MPSFNVSRTILGLTAIAAALPVAGTLASAQSLLSGDVAIIGTYNETAAEFSWVPLVDLPAGEVIYFSDAGYSFAADAFQGTDRTEEWLLRYVAPAGGVAAGTVQTVVDGTSPADYDGPGMSTEFGARDLGPTIDLSMTGLGDELIAFQSADDPTQATFGQTSFTALFQTDPGSFTRPLFTFDDTAVTHTTDVAPGLTVGQNAVGLRDDGNDDEFDNIRYIGSVSGTQAELLAAISDSANWEGTNDEQIEGWTSSLGGGTFNVLPDGPMLVTNVTQGTQFVKLQDALNNAVTGDAIEIAAGTLFESLIIWPQDLSVSILGAGPGQTIIDGQYEATLMVMVGNDTTIEGITFQNGRNSSFAAVLDVIQGAITVSNCHFVANDGENALGAVIDTLAGSIAIEHCHFYQNFDGTSIAQFTDAQVAFVECLFYDNATTHHEVRAAGTANVGVFNCTMSGAADDSFIFAFDANATVSATNSVFTPNPNGAVGGLGTATTTRSLFAGATGDNVDGTPTFVDAANGDYRLAPGSLGIDAADYDAYITAGGGAFDLAGNWRRVDAGAVNTGVGTFSYLDMGAYETSALAMDCNMNGVDDAADLGAKAGLTDFENGAGHAYTLNTNGAATPMVDNGSLRLTEAEILSQVASAVFDPQLPAPVEGFQVTFDFRFGPGTFEGADGISFALLDKQAHGLDALFSEFGPANDALVVRIHDFTSQTIELFYNGTLVASVPSPVDLDNQQWHHMSIVLAGGNVFVDLIPWNEAPATVISAAVPSYTPIEALYGFGARTGAVTNEQRIDNVRFTSQQSNDCDANGTPDECDEDVNGDNIPDACQCLGDLDNSGAVDVSDLLMLLAGWGTPETDVTGDGVTDVTDLLALLAGWGACS